MTINSDHYTMTTQTPTTTQHSHTTCMNGKTDRQASRHINHLSPATQCWCTDCASATTLPPIKLHFSARSIACFMHGCTLGTQAPWNHTDISKWPHRDYLQYCISRYICIYSSWHNTRIEAILLQCCQIVGLPDLSRWLSHDLCIWA